MNENIEPNRKYKVIKGNSIVPAGTVVDSPSPGKFEESRGAIHKDSIQCSLGNGKGWYFTKDELEPA